MAKQAKKCNIWLLIFLAIAISGSAAYLAYARPFKEETKAEPEPILEVPKSIIIDNVTSGWKYKDGKLESTYSGDQTETYTWGDEYPESIESGENKITFSTKTDPVDGTVLLNWTENDGKSGKNEMFVDEGHLERFTIGEKDENYILKSENYSLSSKEYLERYINKDGKNWILRWEESIGNEGTVRINGGEPLRVLYNNNGNPIRIEDIHIQWQEARDITPFCRAYVMSLLTQRLATELCK